MSELTKALHKEFTILDRVAFIGYKIPSSTVRNDLFILLLNAVEELEKAKPESEILVQLKELLP
jgi:squalene cyclase